MYITGPGPGAKSKSEGRLLLGARVRVRGRRFGRARTRRRRWPLVAVRSLVAPLVTAVAIALEGPPTPGGRLPGVGVSEAPPS